MLILNSFSHDFNLWQCLSNWIDYFFRFSIRKHIQNFVTNNYDQTTGSFINLILFNLKDQNGKVIYYHMINLSIVYLIVVSGFHISILKRLVSFALRKWPILANIVNIIIITFYCYLLSFAVSVTRVLLMFLISFIFKKRLKNKIDVLAVAGLFSIMWDTTCMFNIGFCMSYLCTTVILLVYRLKISNMLLEKLLINIAATLISLPFIIYMQNQISLWAVFNSFIFSYVFAFIFIYFLLTFWLVWIVVIQHAIVIAVNFVINASWFTNIIIRVPNWSPLIQCGYFIVSYLTIRMLKSYKTN
ncbi:MAG: ComEC/Rec2 family competence protein [Mycoplasmataceae bacterium]|nr:ComEC/Rec2 family competence protein [Mycoplasmataceae bacterium]